MTPLGQAVVEALGEEWMTAEQVAGSPRVRGYLESHHKANFAHRLVTAALNGLCEDRVAEVWSDGSERRWRLRQ